MSSGQHIHYLSHNEIDMARWNACIEQAANSLIYGFHFYLDHMAAQQWDALILGDYEAVMPLPWRSKYSIRYLYQPPYTQQTGIFAKQLLSTDLLEAFLQAIQKHFRFAELFLNYDNALPSLQPRTNYILSLDAPYPQLAAGYKRSLNESLRIAARSTLHYTSSTNITQALADNRKEYASRTPHVRAADHQNFERLCHYLQTHDQLLLRTVTGPAGSPLATVLLLRDRHRLYLVQSTTPPAGRKTAANHFLMDELIKEFAGQKILLDFEGSTIPGIAHFYSGFGAVDQPYYFYRYNNLPWPLRWLKR